MKQRAWTLADHCSSSIAILATRSNAFSFEKATGAVLWTEAMAIPNVNASLRGPRASVVKYDIVAAINGAGLAKAAISRDLAQRLTLLIVCRYNWITNEVSAGHAQLSILWSVDLRRVKRIISELRALGILGVKRAGRKGLVTVYRLDLARIAELTRPNWQGLGADIAARLDAAFPPDPAPATELAGFPAERALGGKAHDQASNVVAISEVRRACADAVRGAVAQEIARPVFDRWIRPLVQERRDDCLVFMAGSCFMANYVERQFGDRIVRVTRRLFPEIRRVVFTVAPVEASTP